MAKIKDLPKILRPREKLLKYGPEKLSNSELLAILLRTGQKGKNVVELAGGILKRHGSQNLPNLDIKNPQRISRNRAGESLRDCGLF